MKKLSCSIIRWVNDFYKVFNEAITMNYRHTYHAGNFGDVFKHILLIELITALQRKENPFCVLDTHAGIGSYDLSAHTTQKLQEYKNGVYKIMAEKNLPESAKKYVECIKNFNAPETPVKIYPGSPLIANYFLRNNDRLILSELHPTDYETLKKVFRNEKNTAVHHQDAYLSLKAFLPPKERRGLILIDPPYENNNEFAQITEGMMAALDRFETGVYAIWYPIKDKSPLHKFTANINQPMIAAEMTVFPETSPLHLNGCGMLVINPPWQFDQTLKNILPWLWEKLSVDGQGRYHLVH
jgi:23S rRNA (adenine2030-N6)-methyltransferase